MKRLFVVGLVIFWGVTVSLMTAGLVVNETKTKEATKGVVVVVATTTDNIIGTEALGDSTSPDPSGFDSSKEYTTISKSIEKQQYLNTSIIAEHSTKEDCWLLIDGGVYDVGEYVPFHPGGEDEIIPYCGKESTSAFNTRGDDNQPHSATAKLQLSKYLVANIGDPWGTITVVEEVQVPVGDSGQTGAPSTEASVDGAAGSKSENNNTELAVVETPIGSGKFSVGTKIKTSTNVKVRQTADASGVLIKTENTGTTGTITNGPKYADGYWWYYIKFSDGVSGWSAQDFFVKDTGTVVDTNTEVNNNNNSYVLTAPGVATHSLITDCWLIISNKIYDVTEYIPFHPGGTNEIVQYCGRESTAAFENRGGTGTHSNSANNLLENYYIGNLEGALTAPEPGTSVCSSWTYGSWNTCTSNNIQTRSIISSSPSGCTGGSPIVSQSCTYTQATCSSWTYGAWGSCQSNGSQSRSVIVSSPSGCTGGSPITTQSCSYTPPSNGGGLTSSSVSTHNSTSDCWLIVSGNVYDVTQYIPFHPGGTNEIVQYCGQESTTPFNNRGGTGTHSNSANNLLANYLIGSLEGGSTQTGTTCSSFTYSSWNACQSNNTQTRTVLSSSPSGCTGGSPITTQGCTFDPGTPDITPPTMVVISPSDGALVSGDITVQVTATDSSGVTYVEFRVDNQLLGTDTSSPYSTLIDTTLYSDGVHTLSVRSADSFNNITNQSVSINVNNAPAPPPPPPPTGGGGGMTAADVATHNTLNDCWLIISGNIYSVAQYVPFHPGGQNAIVNVCGSDATTLFTSNVGAGHNHSTSANNLLANYLVGPLDGGGGGGTTPPPPGTPECTSWTYSAWGMCLVSGTQSRSVLTSSPPGCAGGTPLTSQSCTYTPPASPDQPYRDTIEAAYPGANITKLSLEDDGNAEFKFTHNGQTYEGKMNAQYQITEIQ